MEIFHGYAFEEFTKRKQTPLSFKLLMRLVERNVITEATAKELMKGDSL